jgi:hypothetical protein
MTILSYASTPVLTRRPWWHWTIVVLLGIFVGAIGGRFCYEPVLGAILQHTRVDVQAVDEPFRSLMRFIIAACIGGAIVGLAALASTRRRTSLLVASSAFSVAYFAGAVAGLLYARWKWAAIMTALSSGNLVFSQARQPMMPTTPPLPNGISLVSGVAIFPTLGHVPMLAVPMGGILAVLCVFSAVVAHRVVKEKRQRTQVPRSLDHL